jgi:hypothetical protein
MMPLDMAIETDPGIPYASLGRDGHQYNVQARPPLSLGNGKTPQLISTPQI